MELEELILKISESAGKAREVFAEIKLRIQYTFNKSPEVFYNISKYGWYIDSLLTPAETFDLNDLLNEGKIADVDEFFMNYYENQLKEIQISIQSNFPKRIELIKEAFTNYKEGRYYSSILILLSQIDGFCFDKYEKLYFKNKKNTIIPEVEEKLREKSNSIMESFLAPIEKATLINEHTSKLENYPK